SSLICFMAAASSEAGEQVVPASELAAAMKQIKELHRFLAEQALEFFNLLYGGSKFRGRRTGRSCL
ncbi:hypothetical protein PSZ14_23455, partial [Shigella flexneri]|nr:hypothetical protein [Shigella flexneri]